jgi:uncharacterized protein
MIHPSTNGKQTHEYVGTLVGESTSTQFRLAVAHGAVREQDLIAVDAELRDPVSGGLAETVRVWAKVQQIERLNPLFPVQAGHELAATRTNPLDTVLSMSREMVTAVCRVLGSEPLGDESQGKLDPLRYPPQPASSAYRPDEASIARVVMGERGADLRRSMDIAVLSNRPEVSVLVDGHAVVTRHLAILAMTGAGKSWAARRIIEQLARKNYPIVIFDPHGDYTGLADVPHLRGRVQRYFAQFPVFNEPAERVVTVVESLAWTLSNNQRALFDQIFAGARSFIDGTEKEIAERTVWLSRYLTNENIRKYGIQQNLYFLADFTEVLVRAGRNGDTETFRRLRDWSAQEYQISKQQSLWTEGLTQRLRVAAHALRRMENISRLRARDAMPLPGDRTELIQYGGISIISLAGYTTEFQATIYNLVAEELFDARVRGSVRLPFLMLLEEAHNFVPGQGSTQAERHAISTTRQIAQEGRKFGVGLILISQRPSRLDATTLSQCNSHLVMRMVNPADQQFVRQVVETLGEDEARMLPDLKVGEAILSGQLTNFPVLVRMREPESKGEREEQDAFESLEMAHAEAARARHA